MLHVRRKIWKMKKIEASLIKRLLRISWKVFFSCLVSVIFLKFFSSGLVSETLVSLVLGLSFYSLSLSHFLGHLEFSWITLGEYGIPGCLEKEGKGREGKRKSTLGSTSTRSFSCRYRVACMFSSLVFACMAYACGLLVMICHWHGGFHGLTVDLPSLAISEIGVNFLFLFFF